MYDFSSINNLTKFNLIIQTNDIVLVKHYFSEPGCQVSRLPLRGRRLGSTCSVLNWLVQTG